MDFSNAVTSTPHNYNAKQTKQKIVNGKRKNSHKYIKGRDVKEDQHICNKHTSTNVLLPIGAERKLMSTSTVATKEIDELKTSSLLFLEFEIKGEQMVSKLCDSSDSTENELKVNDYVRSSKDVSGVDNINLISADIKKLAYEACEAAEKISKNSASRCFNGMQYLCSKAKENIERSDSAVTKLQSQGLPWVIKTFILSLLKIVDGWKCLSEIMDSPVNENAKVKYTFQKWESITKIMLYKIYKTYESLNDGLKEKQQVHSVSVYKQMLAVGESVLNLDKHEMLLMNQNEPNQVYQMGNIQCQCVTSESEIVKYSDSNHLQEVWAKVKLLKNESQTQSSSRDSCVKISKNLSIKPNRKSKKKNSNNNYQKTYLKK